MSTTTLTTNGSNTAVTLNSTLLSTVNCVQNWKYTYNISYSAPKNILEINDAQGQPILKIDNQVQCHGRAVPINLLAGL